MEMANIEIIREKIGALGTDALVEMARALKDDFREGTDVVLGEILVALDARMGTDEYTSLCEELEG